MTAVAGLAEQTGFVAPLRALPSQETIKAKLAKGPIPLVGAAGCRSGADDEWIDPNDWTPEFEEEHVPARLRARCDACPLWEACLVEAVRMNDIGYRASMTTRQRRALFADLISATRSARAVSVPSCRAGDRDRTPTHARGEGSLNTYRRGCRCDECRGHNAAARRRERARAS